MKDSIPRGELAPGEDSWHLKTYRWGMEHGKRNKPGYRENLCHYMRVILIWVPLLWFFKVPIRKKGTLSYVRPWEIVAVPTFLTCLSLFVYKLYTIIDWRDFWNELWLVFRHPSLSLIVYSLVCTFLLICIFKVDLIKYFFTNYGKYFRFFLVIGHPICRIYATLKWLAVFVFKPRFYYLGVWTVLLIASIAGFAWIWTEEAMLAGWWTVVGLIVTAAVISTIVAIFGLSWLLFDEDYLDLPKRISQKYNKSDAPKIAKKKGTSFFRMLWHFVLAKKYKICPFIILPEDRVQMAVSEE